MSRPPNLCVVVPVHNHARTVLQVVRSALRLLPVIVVDDGSTDTTPRILDSEPALHRLAFPVNRGKGAALCAGFARAQSLGYAHAITLDADGQHPAEAVPLLADTTLKFPEAIILGERNLKTAGAPWPRRLANNLSSVSFRWETGLARIDTQTGLRSYPLPAVNRLRVQSTRYAWELEVLVRAAWAGIPIVSRSVTVDYQSPTSRLSHFRPVRDFLHIACLHAILTLQAAILPRSLRRLTAQTPWNHVPIHTRRRLIVSHLLRTRPCRQQNAAPEN